MTSCKALSESDFATLTRLRQDDSRNNPFTPMATQTGAGKRIVFTGGSGKAGRHAIPELLKLGYKVLNLDLAPFPDPHADLHTLKADLTDGGQVFSALTSHYGHGGYTQGYPEPPPDAVIHFAAIPVNLVVPDNECFRINVLSTYNVIEAACKLGVKKIIIASSETTYGLCFSEGDVCRCCPDSNIEDSC